MTTRTHRLLAGLIALALGLSPLRARGATGEPREHDGLFIRASAGIGAARGKLEANGGDAELHDAGLDVNLAFGAIVLPNLAVHATLWGWGLNDPGVEVKSSIGNAALASKGVFEMTAFGVGATYYLMPINAYVSASLGSGAFSGTDQLDGTSNRGFAYDITAGKEWWANDEWGVGAAGSYSYCSATDKDLGPAAAPDGKWTGTSWALRFTATFN